MESLQTREELVSAEIGANEMIGAAHHILPRWSVKQLKQFYTKLSVLQHHLVEMLEYRNKDQHKNFVLHKILYSGNNLRSALEHRKMVHLQ